MKFKDAWRVVGNTAPGNASWSGDVNDRPVFTVWRGEDLGFDREARRSTFDVKPGPWVTQVTGKSYIRRARQAMEQGWVCRLIVLDGSKTGEHVECATLEDNLFAVRFTEVNDQGVIRGQLLTRDEYESLSAAGSRDDS